MSYIRNNLIILAIIICLTGCATTTGPKITNLELQQAEQELKLKAMAFNFRQQQRVSSIGYRLLSSLPKEDAQGVYPYSGVVYSKIDKDLAALYNLQQSSGLVVNVVAEGGPAYRAGIRPGDVILGVDGKDIKAIGNLASYFKRYKPGQAMQITILRNGIIENRNIVVGSVPLNVAFDMDSSEGVNAGASSGRIMVTYGATRFTKSDDELAVMLGHELAHLTRGHIAKSVTGQVVGVVAAIGLGVLSEMVAPGTGGDVAKGVSEAGQMFGRVYSQDLERESDYYGIKYVYLAGYDINAGTQVWERFAVEVPQSMVRDYLSTHPSSPERYVRIKKAIAEIKAKTPATVILPANIPQDITPKVSAPN